mmetsp:Transcript_4392/g.4910  ORF Transcript_4392/g.4910 Transcript_4392/m.4910 type:complete len:107 (+) Transcript_4392:71-391(+)
MSSQTIAVGLKKGYIVSKIEKSIKKDRPSFRKGKLGQKVQFVREVVREVAGWAPYERRILELLKVGGASEERKAMKIAKKRLGTHKRAKGKKEELKRVAMAMRRKA